MLSFERINLVRQRGLSMVELQIGIVVGLFIVAAATFFSVTLIRENQLLLVEARLMQDMRSAMDLITRDVRRAGYWGNSLSGVIYPGATSIAQPYSTSNYTVITPSNSSTDVVGCAPLTYFYTPPNVTASNTPSGAESFGISVCDGVLRLTIGAPPTPVVTSALTDANTTRVNSLTVTPTLSLAGAAVCVRRYTITLNASSVGANPITRQLQSEVRVRNDRPSSTACP